jgi:alkylation response protein AidB-like acyl-CoA dehydrogenase
MAAELNKRITELTVDLLGAEGTLYGSYEMTRPVHALQFNSQQQAFLRMRANSIEGGTSEIMRNILGERILGLPGDVRVDKDRPWSQVPRS